MDNASPPPGGSPPGPTDTPGGPQRAADPLAGIIGHCAATWQALRTHVALLVDDGIERFYGLLATAALVMTGLSIILLLTTMGCYYLVSGIALGMTELVGSVWIGHACAGAMFLIGPALIGYCFAAARRRARQQRIISSHRRLQDQAVAP
jgi:hypothetical protein